LKNGVWCHDPALRGFVNAQIPSGMLRFPKRRAPWLTAPDLFLNSLLEILRLKIFAGR
jgi:hypothetical protein